MGEAEVTVRDVRAGRHYPANAREGRNPGIPSVIVSAPRYFIPFICEILTHRLNF